MINTALAMVGMNISCATLRDAVTVHSRAEYLLTFCRTSVEIKLRRSRDEDTAADKQAFHLPVRISANGRDADGLLDVIRVGLMHAVSQR